MTTTGIPNSRYLIEEYPLKRWVRHDANRSQIKVYLDVRS